MPVCRAGPPPSAVSRSFRGVSGCAQASNSFQSAVVVRGVIPQRHDRHEGKLRNRHPGSAPRLERRRAKTTTFAVQPSGFSPFVYWAHGAKCGSEFQRTGWWADGLSGLENWNASALSNTFGVAISGPRDYRRRSHVKATRSRRELDTDRAATQKFMAGLCLSRFHCHHGTQLSSGFGRSIANWRRRPPTGADEATQWVGFVATGRSSAGARLRGHGREAR